MLDRVGRDIDALDGDTRDQFGHVVKHETLGAADVKQFRLRGQAEVPLERLDDRLPKPWVVRKPAVASATVAVEELPVESPGDRPVGLGLVGSPGCHVSLGLWVICQQINLVAHALHSRPDLSYTSGVVNWGVSRQGPPVYEMSAECQ